MARDRERETSPGEEGPRARSREQQRKSVSYARSSFALLDQLPSSRSVSSFLLSPFLLAPSLFLEHRSHKTRSFTEKPLKGDKDTKEEEQREQRRNNESTQASSSKKGSSLFTGVFPGSVRPCPGFRDRRTCRIVCCLLETHGIQPGGRAYGCCTHLWV